MKGHAVALIGICLLTFFAGLGAPAIADSDEAFYAESAREMVELGDWLTPHFNYIYRFEKPILYYWLVAIAYTVGGVSEAAARFPSALAGLGLTLLTFGAARRYFDSPTALLAGLITATSFGCVGFARQALPDLTLAFFIALATWASLVAWMAPTDTDAGGPDPAVRTIWVIVAALGAAGAFLTKGPVGLALPVLVVGPLLLWNAWVRRAPLQVRLPDLALGAGVFVVIAAPWYLAMTFEHGLAYLDRFFIAENLDRFATPRYNAPRPVWYYLPIILGGLLPWSPFVLLWGPMIRRAFSDGIGRATTGLQLAWWAVAPLAFYTVSYGKQPRYILPILPPLAILLARAIRQQLATRHVSRVFATSVSVAGILIAGVGLTLYRARHLLSEWDVGWVYLAAGSIIASGCAVLACLRRPSWVPGALAASTIVVTLATHLVVLSSPGPAPVERVSALLATERSRGQSYGRYAVLHRNLIFYARAPFIELPIERAMRDYLGQPDRVLCVLPSEEMTRLRATGVSIRSLGEVRYLNTGDLTLRVLLDPDPARYVGRVAVVTNR